jgi:mannose-6-phosphate isomerase-like protein (cupin superfamily)
VKQEKKIDGAKNTLCIFSGKARLVAEVTIPSGASIGFHRHEGEEEIYYILSGSGEVDDQGEVDQIGRGDVVLTGGGNRHAVRNTGTVPLVLLAIILVYLS